MDKGDEKLITVRSARCYERTLDPEALYVLGDMTIRLNNYAEGRLALELYLAKASPHVPTKRRADIETSLRALRLFPLSVSAVTSRCGKNELVAIEADVAVSLAPNLRHPPHPGPNFRFVRLEPEGAVFVSEREKTPIEVVRDAWPIEIVVSKPGYKRSVRTVTLTKPGHEVFELELAEGG